MPSINSSRKSLAFNFQGDHYVRPFQTAVAAMQNGLIETLLSSAEAAHEASMKAPLMSVKFNTAVLRQLIAEYDFHDEYAEAIVLNMKLPPVPAELLDVHVERAAAMAAARLNRLYEQMVEVGFSPGLALCAYVGKQA